MVEGFTIPIHNRARALRSPRRRLERFEACISFSDMLSIYILEKVYERSLRKTLTLSPTSSTREGGSCPEALRKVHHPPLRTSREGDQFGVHAHLSGGTPKSRKELVHCCGTMASSGSDGQCGFLKRLNSKSPSLDQAVVDEPTMQPSCRPLDDVPSRYEADTATICAMPSLRDGLWTGLLKLLPDEGDPDTLGNFEIIVVWCVYLSRHLPINSGACWQIPPRNHHGPHQ